MILSLFLCLSTVLASLLIFKQKETQNLKNDKQISEDKIKSLENDISKFNTEILQLKIEKAKLEGELQNLKDNKRQEENIQNEMKIIFQNLSNNTLEKQNEIGTQKIGALLKPFQDDLKNCKTAIDEINLKTKTEIKNEISKMLQKTDTLEKSATDLVRAFRGENKIQGNWGENQLEEILKNAGLEGQYEKQFTFNHKGATYRPDFIIKLPDGKRFIIDSKVSMENYINYYNSTDDNEKQNYIKLHIQSIKRHIDELKKYQESFKEYIKTLPEEKLETLDFNVMFISPENAYVDAVIYSKQDILKYAYDNKVAIVTASSLMPVLRMISHLWNIEKSNKNINEIVEKVAILQDKLSKFCEQINKTHVMLVNAVKAHEEATKYLSTGNSSVLTVAKKIQELMNKKDEKQVRLFINAESNNDNS